MHTDDASEVIQQVIDEFKLRSTHVELLSSTDHCNAKIVTKSGSYFLKILAAGYSKTRLRSQMMFADFLREDGLPIPAPLSTVAGQRFATTIAAGEIRFAVLSPWIPGEPLGDRIEPEWIERCGALLARLHVRSQDYDPPDDFDARAWDEVYAPIQGGWLSLFLADSRFDDDQKTIIEKAAARTRAFDSQLPKDRQTYGLIHADFHGDNLIFDGETIWVVDLEDVGWAHRLFDVAWSAVLFAKHQPESDQLLRSLLRGYRRTRRLSAAEIEALPEFQLAAGIGVLEMIHTAPIANDDPVAIEWVDFALGWLRTHLNRANSDVSGQI